MLKEKKRQEYSIIKDSVNLGIEIADLYAMFNVISSRINKLENVEKKAELVELLAIIKDAILQMQKISTEHDQKVADANPCISEAFLNEQKRHMSEEEKILKFMYGKKYSKYKK